MKTKMISKLAGLATILLALFIAPDVKAQSTCPYAITNNLGCDVVVMWSISPPNAPNCNFICNQGGSGTILAGGGVFNIPCSAFTCGATACMVKVTLMVVDNISITPFSDISTNGTAIGSGTGAGLCPGTVNVACSPGGTVIY